MRLLFKKERRHKRKNKERRTKKLRWVSIDHRQHFCSYWQHCYEQIIILYSFHASVYLHFSASTIVFTTCQLRFITDLFWVDSWEIKPGSTRLWAWHYRAHNRVGNLLSEIKIFSSALLHIWVLLHGYMQRCTHFFRRKILVLKGHLQETKISIPGLGYTLVRIGMLWSNVPRWGLDCFIQNTEAFSTNKSCHKAHMFLIKILALNNPVWKFNPYVFIV